MNYNKETDNFIEITCQSFWNVIFKTENLTNSNEFEYTTIFEHLSLQTLIYGIFHGDSDTNI